MDVHPPSCRDCGRELWIDEIMRGRCRACEDRCIPQPTPPGGVVTATKDNIEYTEDKRRKMKARRYGEEPLFD